MKNLFFSPPAFSEGEVLILSADSAAVQTAIALTGVSGQAHSGVTPRLILCDADDEAQCSAAKKAHASDIPVLFLTRNGTAPTWEPPAYALLSVPIRFSEFHRTVLALLEGSPSPAQHAPSAEATPQSSTIRIESGAAVSGRIRVPLTPCEEKILTALTDAYPHAASGAQLEEAFKRHGGNSVRVYISYLRKKLTALPAYRAILPEKGGGFSLVLQTDNTDKG